MTIRLASTFRASVLRVRDGLGRTETERRLFDLICAAGELAYRLPDDCIHLRHVAGAKDPRRRLLRECRWIGGRRLSPAAWRRTSRNLARVLTREIAAKGDGDSQPLRVLLQYAPIGLAPDCVVPIDPTLRAAWDTLVEMFIRLCPTKVRSLDRLACVSPRRLEALRREAARGLRLGRRASGRRPGPVGRSLAVDPALTRLVGQTLGRRVSPGYVAKFLYYTHPGDHIWPHADDPNFSVNFLLCLDRELPLGSSHGSALLAYRPGGVVERHELEPGRALAMESGVIHAREPMRTGERVVLLSILYR